MFLRATAQWRPMAEPFKNLLNAAVVRDIGGRLERHLPGFPRRRFERLALAGLDTLEMKARAMQIASALEACLPPEFAAAAEALEAAIADGLRAGRCGRSANSSRAADSRRPSARWPRCTR
jgi:hypothetical protein